MKAKIVVKTLKTAFSAFLKNWFLVLPSAFIDLIFLLAINTAYFLTASSIMNRLSALLGSVADSLSKFSGGAMPDASFILKQQTLINVQINIVLTLILYFALFSFAMLVLLQSLGWRISLKISGIKTRYFSYLAQFGLFSLIFGAIIAAAGYGFFKTTFTNILEPTGNEVFFGVLFLISALISVYFGIISYSYVGKIKDVFKQFFLIGIKKAHLMLLACLIISAMFGGLVLFSWLLMNYIDPIIAIIAGTILVLPLISFARIYFILVVHELKK